MTEDVAEYWWSNTARGPYGDDAGTICYVDGGRRFSFGGWAPARAGSLRPATLRTREANSYPTRQAATKRGVRRT